MVKGKLVKSAKKKLKKTDTGNKAFDDAKNKFLTGAAASTIDEVIDNPLVSAAEGAAIGFALGGPIGALGGGVAGWFLADNNTVMPVDMIAIPAYQAYLIQGDPAFQIYIRAGETIIPTGGNVRDVQEAQLMTVNDAPKPKRSRAKGAGLPKKYAKMGFKKGWREYKKTAAYKKKASKKRRKK